MRLHTYFFVKYLGCSLEEIKVTPAQASGADEYNLRSPLPTGCYGVEFISRTGVFKGEACAGGGLVKSERYIIFVRKDAQSGQYVKNMNSGPEVFTISGLWMPHNPQLDILVEFHGD